MLIQLKNMNFVLTRHLQLFQTCILFIDIDSLLLLQQFQLAHLAAHCFSKCQKHVSINVIFPLCILLHLCYLFYSVPGAPVQNITVIVQSPTSVAISWYPPNVQEWNGIVTGYTVQYELLGSVDEYPELQPFLTFTTSIPSPGVPLQNDPDPRTVGLPLQMETAVVSNLQEYFVYQFVIYFGNSVGESDGTAPIIQEMPQAGKKVTYSLT